MKRKVARNLSVKLWSTRISSSRQFVPCAGAAVKKHWLVELPGTQVDAFDPVGAGIIVRSACATAWLAANAGNPEILAPTDGQSGPGQISLKSPPRSATDGTGT